MCETHIHPDALILKEEAALFYITYLLLLEYAALLCYICLFPQGQIHLHVYGPTAKITIIQNASSYCAVCEFP